MCGSMVDIQSATAEIRRGKKKEEDRRKKPQDKNIKSASVTQGGHNKPQEGGRFDPLLGHSDMAAVTWSGMLVVLHVLSMLI